MGTTYGVLSDKLYTVLVPRISTYTEEELMFSGIPNQQRSSGRLDATEEELVRVMLPLSRIVDIYTTGAKISIVHEHEMLEIYSELEQYLTGNNSFTPELNMDRNEKSRNVDIDRFAAEIFEINRGDIVNNQFNQRSGFDIGIRKMSISSPIKPAKRVRVIDRFSKENPTVASGMYITHNTNTVDPATVSRPARITKRRRVNRSNDVS